MSTTTRRSTPLPGNWHKIRLRIARRDRNTCQLAYPGCLVHCPPRAGGECDHVGDPADHSPANLRWACKPCHATRTGRQAREAQPKRTRPTERHPGLTEGGG